MNNSSDPSKKPPKKNGFSMFVSEQKQIKLKQGVKLPDNFRELATLFDLDWRALSAEEKAKYKTKADMYNQRRNNPELRTKPDNTGRSRASANGGTAFTSTGSSDGSGVTTAAAAVDNDDDAWY